MQKRPINDMEIFMQNVAWLRKRFGLSKQQMAKYLQIGVGSLTKLEQGILPPRLDVEILFTIQVLFGVPISVLLGQRLEEIYPSDEPY